MLLLFRNSTCFGGLLNLVVVALITFFTPSRCALSSDRSDSMGHGWLKGGRRRVLLQQGTFFIPWPFQTLFKRPSWVETPTLVDEQAPAGATFERLSVPLIAANNAYCVDYQVDGSRFRAVVDTGSPFLLVPGSCGENTRAKVGCYRQQGRPSGLKQTIERFDGFEGLVEWRVASFAFVNATGSLMGPEYFVFGVVDDDIMSGPGGVFLGLIRDTDDWIRPSFLGQTRVQAFCIDLVDRILTISTKPIISRDNDAVPLTNDLKRYGDVVRHYTAKASSVLVNGEPIIDSDDTKSPVYVIFDTGVTGMVVSENIYLERYRIARQRREKNLWGQVKIGFQTSSGATTTLSATKPLVTLFDPKQVWKKFNGYLIIAGLAFLDERRLSIDIDAQRIWFDGD